MSAYTEEEKIKILYEQSLRDIRDVVSRIESVAGSIRLTAGTLKEYETDARTKSAATLSQASSEIRQAVQMITGIEQGMQSAAASAARAVLMGDTGPVRNLQALVRTQQEALGWLNRAAERYAHSYWIASIVGLSAGIVGGLIVKFA